MPKTLLTFTLMSYSKNSIPGQSQLIDPPVHYFSESICKVFDELPQIFAAPCAICKATALRDIS